MFNVERLLKITLGVVVLVAAWFVLAPTQFGGRTAYVMVSGNSMEPTLSRDDLVVLRKTGNYAVGDVVTYRNEVVGMVIHRITGVEGEQFILQGDNNHWTDSYQPVADEIVGKMWFALPGGGLVVEWLRSPVGATLLAGVLGLLIFWPVGRRDAGETRPGVAVRKMAGVRAARDGGQARESSARLAAGLREIAAKLTRLPVIVWQKGKPVAFDSRFAPQTAAGMAWLAWTERPNDASEWACKVIAPSGRGAPARMLYSVVVAKSLTLTVLWDGELPAATLRGRTQKAVWVMRRLIQTTNAPGDGGVSTEGAKSSLVRAARSGRQATQVGGQ